MLFSVFLVFLIGSVCVFADGLTYVSSTLWTQLNDVQVEGRYAYCAFANGLAILDVADSTKPSLVSELYFAGTGEGIFVKDNYAYLADGNIRFRIIDVSDPAHPESVSTYDTPGYTYDIVVRDSLAYVADGPYGLQIIRISDPAHPDFLKGLNYFEKLFGKRVSDMYLIYNGKMEQSGQKKIMNYRTIAAEGIK